MVKQSFKMYMVVGTGSLNRGQVRLAEFDPSNFGSPTAHLNGTRLVKEVEVELDIPEFNLPMMELEALEALLEAEKFSAGSRVEFLNEQIAKLKASILDVEVDN